MNISQDEAKEALEEVRKTTKKIRHSFVNSGIHIFLITTGIIWTVGFLANQFLSDELAKYIWIGISILGSIAAFIAGRRKDRLVRGPAAAIYGKRIVIFWIMLVLYSLAILAVVRPVDGKQLTMLIVLFILIGQQALGLLFSYSLAWWLLPITALALAGYFLFPGYFYLWMAVLVGGPMIFLGVIIHRRW